MASRKLEVEIVGDSRSLERAFGRASKSGSGLGRSLTQLGKVAAVGVGAAFAGLAVTLKVGFDELAEGQKVAAQTGAVLKSTGGIANVTAKHVDELASAQSRLTGIDDELIATGENLLLTFKNVRNEVGAGNAVFDRATKSALDLSTAGFGSVESASKMMGKALNDPIKGMTALGRAGVTFSEDQKKAIKALVESGKTLEAQKLILAEVESQVGGSAKAYGETLPGQLSKLRNAFEEVAGGIASAFLPALTRGVEAVAGFVQEFAAAKGFRAKLNVVWTHIRNAAMDVQAALTAAIAGVDWAKVWSGARGIAEGMQTRLEAVDWAAIGESIVTGISDALQATTELAKSLADLVMRAAQAVKWEQLGKVMGPGLAAAVASAFVTLLDLSFWARNWELVLAAALVVFRAKIAEWAGRALAFALVPLARLGEGMVLAIAGAIERLSPRLAQAFIIVTTFAIRALASALATIWGAVEKAAAAVWGKLPALLQSILIVGFIAAFAAAISRLSSAIASAATRAYGWATDIGTSIVDGLGAGLRAGWEKIKAAIDWLMEKIPSWARKLLGISSASTVFIDIGKEIGNGLLMGIDFGTVTLPQKLADKVNEAIDAARQAIESKRSVFQSAFDGLVSAALAAFDRLTQEFETRTERKIRLMDERAAAAERKRAIAEGKAAVAAAEAAVTGLTIGEEETPEEFFERERQAYAALAAARQQFAEAKAAQHRFELEQEAKRERKAYEAKRERQRYNLEQELEAAANAFERGKINFRQYQKRLLAIMEEFHVPFKAGAAALGFQLAQGLRDAFKDVQSAAKALAQEVITQLSNIRVTISVGLSVTNPNSSTKPKPTSPIKPKGFQHGGPFRRGQPLLVGEAGPELAIFDRPGRIIPHGRMGAAVTGGVTVIVNAPNYVGDKRDLSLAMQEVVGRYLRNNGGSFLPG